jgi:hypothetical protein
MASPSACAGRGCRLVSKRFALRDLVGLFDGFIADVAGLDAEVFGAFLARQTTRLRRRAELPRQ